jgi:hypothetical protein
MSVSSLRSWVSHDPRYLNFLVKVMYLSATVYVASSAVSSGRSLHSRSDGGWYIASVFDGLPSLPICGHGLLNVDRHLLHLGVSSLQQEESSNRPLDLVQGVSHQDLSCSCSGLAHRQEWWQIMGQLGILCPHIPTLRHGKYWRIQFC